MTRFVDAILRVAPPWLARGDGGKFLAAIGEVVDDLDLRQSDGVKLRFPGLVSDDSLSMLGRERRIIRGPSEPAATYARRLRRWWTDHKARGGPYALLGQLHAYFADLHDLPRIDVVAASGLRHSVAQGVEDIDAADAITRDSITWDPIPDVYDSELEEFRVEWAHVWVFLHLDGPPATATALVSQAGITLTTQNGDDLLVVTDLSGGDPLAAEEAEVYLVVPRAWSAAHLPYVTVVLLWGNGRLWGYPQPVPTWGSWTWGEDPPVILIAE